MNEHMQQLEEVLTKLAAKLNEFKGQLAANDEKWRAVKGLFSNFNERLVAVEKRLASLPVDRMDDIEELDAVVKAMRAELDEQRKQAATEAHRAAERLTKAQGERDDATKTAAEARERAAGLAGQLQAMQEQNAALLAAINPQGEQKPKKTPPAKA